MKREQNKIEPVLYRCTTCQHEQIVHEIETPDGARYAGSGANWCDKCGNGKPEPVVARRPSPTKQVRRMALEWASARLREQQLDVIFNFTGGPGSAEKLFGDAAVWASERIKQLIAKELG